MQLVEELPTLLAEEEAKTMMSILFGIYPCNLANISNQHGRVGEAD